MDIFQVRDRLPDSIDPVVLVIGKFDGVHKGHQHLLARAKSFCRPDEKLAVVCFTPHPLWALKRNPAYQRSITPDMEKFRWLAHFGVDKVYNVAFTEKYAETSAETFIRDHLDGLNLSHIVVGESFNFGKGRDSDVDLLMDLCGERSVPVTEIPFLRDGANHKVSSTDIRTALYEGDFEKAENLLGHPYFIEGNVRVENGCYLITKLEDFVLPKVARYQVLKDKKQMEIQVLASGEIEIPPRIKRVRIQFDTIQ